MTTTTLPVGTPPPAAASTSPVVLVSDLLARPGWSRRRLDAERTAGRVRQLLPGVVLLGRDPPTEQEQLEACLAYAGPGAALGAATACRELAFRYAPTPVVRTVLLLAPRSAADQPGLVVLTTTRPFTLEPGRPLPVTSRARSLVDACPGRGLADVRALICAAVQRGDVDLDALEDEAARAPRRHGAHLRRAVADARAGAWSAPEAEAADLLAPGRRGRARVHRNCQLLDADGFVLGRPDLHAVGTGAVLQVHSREHHDGDEDFERTLLVDGVLADAGYEVVAVTPRRLRQAPAALQGRWLRTLERQRTRGEVDPPGACRLLDGGIVPHPGTPWPPRTWRAR